MGVSEIGDPNIVPYLVGSHILYAILALSSSGFCQEAAAAPHSRLEEQVHLGAQRVLSSSSFLVAFGPLRQR